MGIKKVRNNYSTGSDVTTVGVTLMLEEWARIEILE